VADDEPVDGDGDDLEPSPGGGDYEPGVGSTNAIEQTACGGGLKRAVRARQPAGSRRRGPVLISPVRDLGAGIAMQRLSAAKFSRCAKLDHLDVTT
jgi:hypothetical protein